MCPFENLTGLPDTNSSDFSEPSTGLSSSPLFSMYLWDACKNGKLFQPEIYRQYMFFGFVDQFLERVFQDVVVPSRFDKTRVFKRLRNKIKDNLMQSELLDSFQSVDTKNSKSVRQFAEDSKQEAAEKLKKISEFLKQDIFPPTLWMELSRMVEVFIECMIFMAKKIEKWTQLRPKRVSQIAERSRLTKWTFRPYTELATSLYETFLNYEKVYLFMELVSCERESELFTEKLWTFKDEHYKNIEPILFDLHNSITALQRDLLVFEPKEIIIDFSKPTSWAFKQLVQTVTI